MLLLLKLLHIASVLALFAGLVGRAVTYRQARQSTELAALVPLLEASGWFDRFLVIPGSMLVLLTGGALADLAHWPFRTGSGTPTWLLVALLVYLSLVPVIAVVLVPRRRRREAAFHASIAARRLTNELASALADPVVTWARRYEWLVMVSVLTLMVLKPF